MVELYGQPDLVLAHEGAEIAVYRPKDPSHRPPRVKIPTIQAGPLGTAIITIEPINPGLGTRPTIGGL